MVKNQRQVLRRHKKNLGVPARPRFREIDRRRADILMGTYTGVTDYWFWRQWLLIALHALHLATKDYDG